MLPANIDNELLIAIVEARPILWQAKHREHKNRVKKNVLWVEVAAIVLPGVLNAENIVQTRWKSLRDKFRRLFVANKKEQKSGAGAEETDEAANVTWPYFEQLMFLKDSIEGRPTSGNMTARQLLLDISSSQSSYADMDATALDTGSLSESSGQDVPLTPTTGTTGESGTADIAPDEPACPPIRPQQKRKRNNDVYVAELQNVTQQLNGYVPKDIDENFALTLLGHMRMIKPERKLDLQMKLLQAIKDFTNEESE
ncbi:transcription factor Adf-1-like [Dermacentor silvarum]|nr:transcription factor Adf-1-like [Dermacentor silvarum]